MDLEQQVEVRVLQEELSRLKALQTHAGFRYLMEIAEAQIDARKENMIFNVLKTLDEVLAQEYAKGEIAGIILFRKIVDIRIQELTELIAEELGEDVQEIPRE